MQDSLNSTPVRRGAVAVFIRDGQFLVIRRSQHVVAPGAYCFPGGGIEADESEAAALVREIEEELGVTIRPVQKIWHSVTPWNVELVWWLTELPVDAELRPNPAEVESIHWCTAEEMSQLPDLLASNLAFLAAVATGEISLTET
jgi:8-oxo-dGTP diphosphatase